MQAVNTIRGVAMPLNRADVDTDQIIPAKYLKLVERTGFGRYLFDSWRKDESFVLNDPAYAWVADDWTGRPIAIPVEPPA